MMDAEVTTSRQLAGSFDLTLNLSDRRGIKMAAYMYSDDTPAEINKRIDQMQDVLDRQAIRADLVNKRAQIDGMHAHLVNLKNAYEGLADKKRAGKKLNSSEIMAMSNHGRQTKEAVDNIASLEAAIAAGEKKLGTG
jgi:uncharacterized lipoprotein NlpE involved in copper resistance